MEARLRQTFGGSAVLVSGSNFHTLSGDQLVSTVDELWLKAHGSGGAKSLPLHPDDVNNIPEGIIHDRVSAVLSWWFQMAWSLRL